MTEAQEQRFLFQWAGYAEQQFPELKLLHHVPNGGKRDARTAANLKRGGKGWSTRYSFTSSEGKIPWVIYRT